MPEISTGRYHPTKFAQSAMRTYSKVGGKLQRWDVGTNDPAEAVAEVANVTRATAMAVVDPLEPLFVPDYSPRFGVKAAARAIAP